MAKLSDCKKGMFLTDGNDWKYKILKVNKRSVTINQRINLGQGVLYSFRSRKPHLRVMTENQISDLILVNE